MLIKNAHWYIIHKNSFHENDEGTATDKITHENIKIMED